MENWADIVGYEGYYQISDNGNVRSCDRWIERSSSRAYIKGKPLKPRVKDNGYLYVGLSKSGINNHYIHRLVLTAFDRKPEAGETASHKDGTRVNNNINNLKWESLKDNMRRKTPHGTQGRGEGQGNSICKDKDVFAAILEVLVDGKSQAQAERDNGLYNLMLTNVFGMKAWRVLYCYAIIFTRLKYKSAGVIESVDNDYGSLLKMGFKHHEILVARDYNFGGE